MTIYSDDETQFRMNYLRTLKTTRIILPVEKNIVVKLTSMQIKKQ
jgi:hypothetical protein